MHMIRRGSRGQFVNDVQVILNYVSAIRPKLVADGIFGPKTQSEVIRFQSSSKLSPDGIVGPMTAHALLKAITTKSRRG